METPAKKQKIENGKFCYFSENLMKDIIITGEKLGTKQAQVSTPVKNEPGVPQKKKRYKVCLDF
jgi:hypothetical protein